MRVLSWNLFHGRDHPPNPRLRTWRSRILRSTERDATHAQVNRPLLEEFAGWLARREWDLALLQEAPPRWSDALARRTRSSAAIGLTSRNSLARLRARIADWNPDLIASNEGGSNQVLARAPARILEVRRSTIYSSWPERRCMLWARVELVGGSRVAVTTLHAPAHDPERAAPAVELAARLAVEWAGADPLVFGGDLNLQPRQRPDVFERLADRFGLDGAGGERAIDHLFARGLDVLEATAPLAPEERDVPGPDGLSIRLSDHAPVTASFGMR